ncbi:uncharacterized protein LOC113521962 [Galleria mellonella]|uniref:Uncharacterized protein LOC113521962 n=1 Tax=Galleria mellonella TaxID=7137 RepID=A0A6J1X874_GALME|nr:uncharacterized protein LOC113521962 [Galleria mellonella]
MEVKLLILSIVFSWCLVQPAYSTSHIIAAKAAVAKAAAAKSVVKGAATIGAGALVAKGAVLKGAALLAAKGVAVKTAALLAAKGAIIKGAIAKHIAKHAILNAKAVKADAVVTAPKQPFIVESVEKAVIHPVIYSVPQPEAVVITPPKLSTIIEKLLGVANATKKAVVTKSSAIADFLSSLMPTKTLVKPPPYLFYGIVTSPKFGVPVIEKTEKC